MSKEIKLDSNYFDTPQEVITEWNRLRTHNQTAEEDAALLSDFYSSLPVEDESTQGDSGGKVMNLGLGADALREQTTSLEGLVTRQGNYLEVEISVDAPDIDRRAGEFITDKMNEAMQQTVEYAQLFWPSVVGALSLTSKAFCVQDPVQGWCPKVVSQFYVPKDSKPIAGSLSYAYRARTFTLVQLVNLKKISGEKSKIVNIKVLDRLIEIVKNNAQQPTTTQSPARIGDGTKTEDQYKKDHGASYGSVAAVEFYEAKPQKDGSIHIASTVIFEQLDSGDRKDKAPTKSGTGVLTANGDTDKDETSGPVVLINDPDAYKCPDHWLSIIMMDTKVGPDKTLDAAQGPAAAQFDRDWITEVLMRDVIEGDRIRALPRYKTGPQSDPNETQEFNIHRSHKVPTGTEEFQFQGSSQLATPMSILMRSSARAKGGNYSGEEELRVQALAQERSSQNLLSIRAEKLYAFLDPIVNEIGRRFLLMPIEPGMEGYAQIKWFRDRMEEAGVPYKELAKSKDGNFLFIKFRAVRALGNGDMSNMDDFWAQLWERLGHFNPGAREEIKYQFVLTKSGNKKLADNLVLFQEDILDPSQVMAELEWPTVVRRGWIGETLSISPQDIHPYHVASHKKDLATMIAAGNMEPWGMKDVTGFAAGVEHTLMHIQMMQEDPASADQATSDWAELQQIAQSAAPLVEAVQQQQAAQAQQLPPELQLKHAHKLMDMELAAQKLGLAFAKEESQALQRKERDKRADRAQFAGETATRANFGLSVAKTNFDQRKAIVDTKLAKEKLTIDKKKAAQKPKTKPKK